MKVITITSKEYAQLYGCTPRYINQVLNEGNLLMAMVRIRKSGGTWLIDVLKNWYDDKKNSLPNLEVKK